VEQSVVKTENESFGLALSRIVQAGKKADVRPRLSQCVLARESNVSQAAISKLCSSPQRVPDPYTAQRLVKALRRVGDAYHIPVRLVDVLAEACPPVPPSEVDDRRVDALMLQIDAALNNGKSVQFAPLMERLGFENGCGSRKQLARRIGITDVHLQRLLEGDEQIGRDTLYKLLGGCNDPMTLRTEQNKRVFCRVLKQDYDRCVATPDQLISAADEDSYIGPLLVHLREAIPLPQEDGKPQVRGLSQQAMVHAINEALQERFPSNTPVTRHVLARAEYSPYTIPDHIVESMANYYYYEHNISAENKEKFLQMPRAPKRELAHFGSVLQAILEKSCDAEGKRLTQGALGQVRGAGSTISHYVNGGNQTPRFSTIRAVVFALERLQDEYQVSSDDIHKLIAAAGTTREILFRSADDILGQIDKNTCYSNLLSDLLSLSEFDTVPGHYQRVLDEVGLHKCMLSSAYLKGRIYSASMAQKLVRATLDIAFGGKEGGRLAQKYRVVIRDVAIRGEEGYRDLLRERRQPKQLIEEGDPNLNLDVA